MGALVGALSVVRSQSEGDRTVNWLLPDVDVYHSEQPLDELRVKLDDFKSTEFTVENGVKYGFWGNNTVRSVYAQPFELFEILAYSGQPVADIPLYETSYERVTTIEYNSTYMNVVFSTTQASLVDGFYQWILKCQDDELYFYHRKVARINFNTAKILHLTVPKLDDDVETLNEFLGANNAENTQYMVDGLHAIIQGEAPCAVDHCWWQGLGPGPGPPTP